MNENSIINFFNVCLENSRSIMQRKKIYRKDIDFIDVTFKFCSMLYEENKSNENYEKLYKKYLSVYDYVYTKFY